MGARNGSHDRRPPTSTSLMAAPVASSVLNSLSSLFHPRPLLLCLSCHCFWFFLPLLQVHTCIYCKYHIYTESPASPRPKPAAKGTIPRPCPAHPRLPPSYCFNLSSFRGAAIARRHNLRVRRGFQVRGTDSLPSACLLRLSIFLCAASYGSLSSATAAAASPRPALQSCLRRCPSSCLALRALFYYYYFCYYCYYCYSPSSRSAPSIASLDTTCPRRVYLVL